MKQYKKELPDGRFRCTYCGNKLFETEEKIDKHLEDHNIMYFPIDLNDLVELHNYLYGGSTKGFEKARFLKRAKQYITNARHEQSSKDLD